jgi:hypothetical protein
VRKLGKEVIVHASSSETQIVCCGLKFGKVGEVQISLLFRTVEDGSRDRIPVRVKGGSFNIIIKT